MNYRQIMIADGAPKGLFLTQAQRAKAWAGRPLTTVPLFQSTPKSETAETAAFRAQVEEERRLKTINGLQRRVRNAQERKAIDYSKMRWDARRAKFVPIDIPIHIGVDLAKSPDQTVVGFRVPEGWQRVDYSNARWLAEINGVWDDKYAKLSGGLLVMTITNRLKGLVKKGVVVSWS